MFKFWKDLTAPKLETLDWKLASGNTRTPPYRYRVFGSAVEAVKSWADHSIMRFLKAAVIPRREE